MLIRCHLNSINSSYSREKLSFIPVLAFSDISLPENLEHQIMVRTRGTKLPCCHMDDFVILFLIVLLHF